MPSIEALAVADDDARRLLGGWTDGLGPDPDLSVSAWSDRWRILSPRGANEAGPWRTSRTPYLQELLDALGPRHPAQRVVFMKGSQRGASESGCNWIGYVIHHAPRPMLAVQPTLELAKRFSQQRVDPLIAECPMLRQKVAPARSRDAGNTQLSKEFPGGILVMTGANSAVGLRSMPVRWLFLDEVDAYPPSADDEGDPVALAEARTRTFSWRRKVFLASTPTIRGLSRIEREFEASDQRRYFVPCPHCGHAQHLVFARLRWSEGRPETAAYVCEGCEQPIAEHHKTQMLAQGRWRATATSTDPLTVGYHLSSLYSPIGWLSWERIARDWEAAHAAEEAKRSFVDTVLGETWVESGEAPDWQRLWERREDLAWGTVPAGGLFLTAGADVQKGARGTRYATGDYRALLEASGIVPSMSRNGNCRGNAPMESRFHTLKTELAHLTAHAARSAAGRDLLAHIERYDNRQRLHSAHGFPHPRTARAPGHTTRCPLARGKINRSLHRSGTHSPRPSRVRFPRPEGATTRGRYKRKFSGWSS